MFTSVPQVTGGGGTGGTAPSSGGGGGGGAGAGGYEVNTKNSSEAKSGVNQMMPIDLQLASGAGNRGFINNFNAQGRQDNAQESSGGGSNTSSSWLSYIIAGVVAVIAFFIWRKKS
jgi:hypothetical protein